MASTIQIFAADPPPILSSAVVTFFTPDGGDDKDNNTQIQFTLSIDFGGGFVQKVGFAPFAAYGRFADGTSSGPLAIPVSGTLGIGSIGNTKFKIDFQPNGDDTWIFNFDLDLKFSDGTVISKTGSGTLSDKIRSLSF